MLLVGDKIKWSLQECINNDASQVITWYMAKQGYCTIAGFVPMTASNDPAPFGYFKEAEEYTYRMDERLKMR